MISPNSDNVKLSEYFSNASDVDHCIIEYNLILTHSERCAFSDMNICTEQQKRHNSAEVPNKSPMSVDPVYLPDPAGVMAKMIFHTDNLVNLD